MKPTHFAGSLLALAVLLSSCSQPESQAVKESAVPEAATPSETSTAKLGDLTEGVPGEVGFQHGLDCTDVDDCSVFFTVEELTQLNECDGYLMEDWPEDKNLIKATIRITTKESTDEFFTPGDFPVSARWSALMDDGVNKSLSSSDSCFNEDTDPWERPLQTGDTEIRTHYMEVPKDATALRLTDRRNGARWEFDLSTQLKKASSPTSSPAPAQQDNVRAEQPAVAEAPSHETPIQQAPIEETPVDNAPAATPVRGFTGAPSASVIEELDKTISHCGDPSLHQTGTTFFTDGTTGWTENCSAEMLG